MAKLSEQLPIYNITGDGVIISDTKASITLCYKMSLPPMYVLSDEEFEDMIETFNRFLMNLGEEIIVHKQDYYFREYFSLVNANKNSFEEDETKEFVKRAYQTHFNERPYLSMESYIYITKVNNTGSGSNLFNSTLMNKDYVTTDAIKFQQTINNNKGILENFGIKIEPINQKELIGNKSIIAQYLNFNKGGEEIKDISFKDNRVFVGNTEVFIYTIENEKQFSTNDFKYHSERQGLAVSYLFPFSFPLAVPHIVNQYIYVPDQKMLERDLQKRISTLKSFDYRGSNRSAEEELITLLAKREELGNSIVYYHCNLMCFDENKDVIEGYINQAFSDLDMVKKTNILLRKDLFWAGVPSNAPRLIEQKKYLMCLMLALEASVLINYENNNQYSMADKGIRLCDRIFGIPFKVDVYDKPLEKGYINNQNMTVISGSGGGKSFFTSGLLLNEYLQGGHIFCIDASYSYKIQCAMHNGVYLTFDESNKITFNPFYLSFLDTKGKDNKKVKQIFDRFDESDKELNQWSQLLQERINTLLGVVSVIVKGTEDRTLRFEELFIFNLFFDYFRDRCINETMKGAKFDDFFDFVSTHIFTLIEKNNISQDIFNPHTFLFMLKQFCSGNSFGYLLNSEDERIKVLDEQRFIVIDVAKITNDKILYGIVSVLAMDLYNQKISKLSMDTVKILCVDEAWQAFASPEMASFLKKQVKIVRKYGGRTIFISQELDDFISSEVLKESIINNSAIKVYLDMKGFKEKFDVIQKVMGISDVNKTKILSLNDPKLMEGKPKYKEVCICTGAYGAVYAVEVPYEIGVIFETNPKIVPVIENMIKEYGSVQKASIVYAENRRNQVT